MMIFVCTRHNNYASIMFCSRLNEKWLRLRFLAKAKRASSLWSSGLPKSLFINVERGVGRYA